MNLPHQEPIKFAQEVLETQSDTVKVKCKFKTLPTLAMFFEAAAQSSAGFSQDEESKIGFLVSLKNVELLKDAEGLEYIIIVEKKVEFGAICEFSFTVVDKNEENSFATGVLTVMIQE